MKDFRNDEGVSLMLNNIYHSASQGDANVQYTLGACHQHGKDTWQNYRIAAGWFLEASEQGHVRATQALGDLYSLWHNVPHDPQKAFESYKTAAEKGDALATLYVGYCYDEGEGVEKDEYLAADAFATAAKLGNAEARRCLGDRFFRGQRCDERL